MADTNGAVGKLFGPKTTTTTRHNCVRQSSTSSFKSWLSKPGTGAETAFTWAMSAMFVFLLFLFCFGGNNYTMERKSRDIDPLSLFGCLFVFYLCQMPMEQTTSTIFGGLLHMCPSMYIFYISYIASYSKQRALEHVWCAGIWSAPVFVECSLPQRDYVSVDCPLCVRLYVSICLSDHPSVCLSVLLGLCKEVICAFLESSLVWR